MEALQAATTQRMIVKRRPSAPTAGGNSLILALDAPLNIGINCTQVLGECFLIGANEGLFITSFHSPKVPINVSGLSAVYHMELLHDLDMMVAISGPQRNLVILHVADLHAAFKSDMPFVRATPISGTDHCHLLTIHHDARKQKRYLCVADPDKITLMQFNSRLNIFTTSTFIPTAEPATCLLSMPFGIVFGADSFYFVDLDKLQPVALNIADCPNDWPLGAVAVSSNEMLLAFQNFGVFVDVRGNRTRRETVDWEQAPLEFVYALPYLFVVHYDTLEIMQVAKYEGSDSRGLLNERDVFRCQNAHFTGRGRTEKEVIFSLSAADRVEVHRFDCSGARKSSLKRRQNHESDERKCMKKAA
ncbi:hypothetical protein AB6A40_004951 [Gnathostoma spinigerum]|uniref:CNH domain-containing protein n=1 Tax=Gnathostoma spinigerum TaxID=75299 RepID=A0ABD6ENJ0_9BILA